MKIGVFSDVHGHIKELHQTLLLLRHLQVDEVICCGDLVDKGAYSDAVIATMQEQNILCVQGNHDFKAQFTWLTHAEPLQDSSLSYLIDLPATLTFDWTGLSVYVCHANPWQDSSIYVFPTRPEALFQQVAEAVTADVIIMGHTHHPMSVQWGNTMLVNPGSIYGNRDRPQRSCGILTLPERCFEIYDIDTGRKLSLTE